MLQFHMVGSILLLEFCVTEMPHCRRLLFLFLLLRRVSITISKRLGAKGEAMSGSGSCAIPGFGCYSINKWSNCEMRGHESDGWSHDGLEHSISTADRCTSRVCGPRALWVACLLATCTLGHVSVGHVHFWSRVCRPRVLWSRVCRPRALGSRVGEATCTFSHVTLGQTHTEVQGQWVTLYSLMARF